MKIICHICNNQLTTRKLEEIPGVDDILECQAKDGTHRHATVIVAEDGATDVWYAYWTAPDKKEYRLSSISLGKTTKLYKVETDLSISLVMKLQYFTPLPLKDDKIDIDHLIIRLLNLKAFS
jgi:hypothetical protein